jgi:hypothetical protein
MSDNKRELDKITANFTQFIIAANGALIAYAIKQAEDRPLEYKLIPLGLAILAWAISFYCGISSIRKIVSARIIEEFRNTSESLKKYPDLYQKAKDDAIRIGNISNRYNNRMFDLLYIGGILYVVWQILEMSFRTKAS